jgi:phenylacetate-CoA ligase
MSLFGARELGDVACETDSRDGLLVAADGYIVEVLVGSRPAEQGELGDVYVTDLNNLCMPFIRYKTGDRAVPLGPDAGFPNARGLPRIGQIQGRKGGVVRGVDGACVPLSFFSALLAEYDYAVRRFSVTELGGGGGITLGIQRAARFSEQTLEDVKTRIRERLGQTAAIEIVLSEDETTVEVPSRVYQTS